MTEETAWQNLEPIMASAGDEIFRQAQAHGQDNIPIEILSQMATISAAISLKRIADELDTGHKRTLGEILNDISHSIRR